MNNRNLGLVTALLLSASQGATALDIKFDYSGDDTGFFNDPQRKRVVEAAGHLLGSRLNDTLNAIPVLNLASGNSFGNIPEVNNQNLPVAKNSILIFVGGEELGVNEEGGDIFGSTPPPGFFSENHRGEKGALDNPPY